MNTTYLIITFSVIAYTVTQLATGALKYTASEVRAISTAISISLSIALLAISAGSPIGKDEVDISPATITKVGDEYIIQSKFPTQISDSMKLEGKTVQVKKVQENNAWGGGLDTNYIVEINEK